MRVRGVGVLVEQLPDLRQAIAALQALADSPSGGVADERHEAAYAFLEPAEAGHAVPVAEYPALLGEIDALIAVQDT